MMNSKNPILEELRKKKFRLSPTHLHDIILTEIFEDFFAYIDILCVLHDINIKHVNNNAVRKNLLNFLVTQRTQFYEFAQRNANDNR